jgi:outer membrane protein assembly factor BamB
MINKVNLMNVMVIVIVVGLCLVQGCLQQDSIGTPIIPEDQDQCVTPIQKMSISAAPGGISGTLNGTLFGVADGDVRLFTNQGDLLWTREGVGSTYALLLNNGTALLAESYNKEESWRSTMVKLDAEGNILWERQTGLIGDDGLAVTPDGSFIAVGAMNRERKGHLMLFDQDGNLLWEDHFEEWIETVAVSTSGYVIAGPIDRYIYVYDCTGELIFSHYAENNYDIQDVAIAPDESYFLFGSERSYLNCYTFEGDLLWKQEAGPLSNIRISADGEYIVVGTANSRLLLFDRHGTNLWDTKVTDAFFIEEVAISHYAEYIAINTQEGPFLPTLYLDVYNREGQLLWRYEGNQPFMAIAISGDGHYIAAGNQNTLVFFDNFQAIEEYAQSECVQPDTSLMIC